IDQSESIGIGILGEADSRPLPADFIGKAGEIGLGGLRFVRKLAIGRVVDVNQLATEPTEERRGGDAAGAVDAVEDDLESLAGNAKRIDMFEHPTDMQRMRLGV